MTDTPWWSREDLWRKIAIWVTSFMVLVLLFLTVDTVRQITEGGERVPGAPVLRQMNDGECHRRRDPRDRVRPPGRDETEQEPAKEPLLGDRGKHADEGRCHSA